MTSADREERKKKKKKKKAAAEDVRLEEGVVGEEGEEDWPRG